MSYDSTIHAKAGELIKLSYEMTAAAGSGHPTTCASLAHLTAVLMFDHMRYEPVNPAHPSSDRLVLSEGHAVPIVYAACADLGVHIGRDPANLRAMTVEDAMSLRAIDSVVDGHPNPVEGFPFFDAATGSLGQGLSVAAGLACAARVDGLDKRVFCIVGDGESREGQVWEAMDFIKDHDLKSVLTIFNANVYAQSDVVSGQQTHEALTKKCEAYGFKTLVIDGHRPSEIQNALNEHAESMLNPEAAPIAVVAKTVKGWGSPSQQGDGHHGKPADGDDMAKALDELTKSLNDLGAFADTKLSIKLMSPKKPDSKRNETPMSMGAALDAFGMSGVLSKGKLATRRAYGVALRAIGHARGDVVALDADVKNSTFAEMFSKDEKLASRFFECRIAEQNMYSVAAGLSAADKVAYCSTFAKFVTRGYDQIEMAINSGANFKIVGSHAGISLAADGPSQMSLPDIAWFRSFATMTRPNGQPGCYVLQPSCAYQAYALTMAMADYDGVCYMRTLRPDLEFLYSENDTFTLGGHEVLSEGRDLLIVATGYMVHQANKALEALDKQGIDATLVDLYSIPFDSDAILDLANANNGNILTLEDNYGGGAGSAIADAAAADGGGFTVKQMHVKRLPKSGRSPEDLMDYCSLSVDDIVQSAMGMLELSTA
ncbi:MAG: transketolase [Phycisphaeraceae bacterium]